MPVSNPPSRPALPNTSLQFNNSGSFGGANVLVFAGSSIRAIPGIDLEFRGGPDNGAGGVGVLRLIGGFSNTNGVSGGGALVVGGDAGTGNSDGGNVGIFGGSPSGTGKQGNIITALPTSDPGVSGALWNNLGIVTVSP